MIRALGICAVLLAGCTTSLPLNDLAQSDRYRSLSHEFGTSVMIIRSYAMDAEGNKVEVAGAKCTARNKLVGFRNVETPAKVAVPTFLQAERYDNRGKPPVLTGSCTYNGQKQTFTLSPTSAVQNTTTSSGGMYDPNTGVYSNLTSTRLNSRLNSTLPWRYPSVVVEF